MRTEYLLPLAVLVVSVAACFAFAAGTSPRQQSIDAMTSALGAASHYLDLVDDSRYDAEYDCLSSHLTHAFTKAEWVGFHQSADARRKDAPQLAPLRFDGVQMLSENIAIVTGPGLPPRTVPEVLLFVREDGEWKVGNLYGGPRLPSWTKSDLSEEETAVLGAASDFYRAWMDQDPGRFAACWIMPDGREMTVAEARDLIARYSTPRRLIYITLPDFTPKRPLLTPPEDAQVQVATVAWSKRNNKLLIGVAPILPLRKMPDGRWRVVKRP